MSIWHAFICIVVLLIIFAYAQIPPLPADTEPFSQYRHKLRTGDIIVLHNGGFVSTMIKIWDGSPATHTGLVIVEDNELYICELDLHTWFGYDVHVSQFDEFMQRQRGHVIGIIPTPKPLPLTRAKMLSLPCKFDITFGFLPLPGRIYCTTLVHRVHRKHGIRPHNGACERCTTPKTYHTDPRCVFLDYTK